MAELFRTHELVHNVRKTVRVVVSTEGDGAIAVVDVDTLWRNRADKSLFHWRGRACKGYTKVAARTGCSSSTPGSIRGDHEAFEMLMGG